MGVRSTFYTSWHLSSVSFGPDGSIFINQAHRYGFDSNTEFIPISAAENEKLYKILKEEKP
ncbi:MAG: hypothetical protein CM15mP10_1000 [Actinomycetota bacterium]|nr:MAG: hypothetical protein CM15mP10_1000 [Actinomycetota bacterium]